MINNGSIPFNRNREANEGLHPNFILDLQDDLALYNDGLIGYSFAVFRDDLDLMIKFYQSTEHQKTAPVIRRGVKAAWLKKPLMSFTTTEEFVVFDHLTLNGNLYSAIIESYPVGADGACYFVGKITKY